MMENFFSSSEKNKDPYDMWINARLESSNKSIEISKLRYKLFDLIVLARVMKSAEKDMADVGMTKEQIVQTQLFLDSMGPEIGKAFLSLPSEIRKKRYERLADTKGDKEKLMREIEKIIAETLGNGKTLGYHSSNNEIKKEGNIWLVKALDRDDRESDLPVAYYSLDREHMYLKGKKRYVYVVQVNIGKNTTHKFDETNKWGRAFHGLDIIDQFEIVEIERRVDELIGEQKMPERNPSGKNILLSTLQRPHGGLSKGV